MRTLRSIRYFLLALVILAIPVTAHAQFGASITIAPPELVVYSQPICPQEGYLWTPGYWGYGDEGYFWVPGTWVEPPTVGYLWTPGYWGWGNEGYAWNGGYWGTEVGFYGGVNYGYGYGGSGYEGGYWRNNQFSYNTYVNNVGGEHFRNTYNKTVVVNTTNYVSYNGGSGGITARPTAAEERFDRGHHTSPTAAQSGQREVASKNREMLASVNHGRPAIAATSKPGEFTGKGVVAARGAPADTKTTEHKAEENKAEANKAAEKKPAARPAANTEHARATPAAHSTTRPAQPAAKSEAARSEVKPVAAKPSERPERQAAPAHTESAPRAAAPQHQAAPKPAAAPKPSGASE
ncbi:MAG: hypothetical protein WAL95_11580 [Candidatus Acidiferrales bacterium]